MVRKDRTNLKKLFQEGQLPREGDFALLIDSMVNIIEDGITSTHEDGLRISSRGDEGRLISFFAKDDGNTPEWTIQLDNSNKILSISNRNAGTVLSLTDEGDIGIGSDMPEESKLDVRGVISMTGRRGIYKGAKGDKTGPVTVKADKQWHKILRHLKGCRAYEIMAGTGAENTGRYAMVHAIAMNCFNGRKSKIKTINASHRWFWHRISFRWTGKADDYDLEVKSWIDFGPDAVIKCYITELWQDYTPEEKAESELRLNGDM